MIKKLYYFAINPPSDNDIDAQMKLTAGNGEEL